MKDVIDREVVVVEVVSSEFSETRALSSVLGSEGLFPLRVHKGGHLLVSIFFQLFCTFFSLIS